MPVYGYCTVAGTQLQSCYAVTSGDGNSTPDYGWADSDDCHLDASTTATPSQDGGYGYVLTDSYPYTPPGYRRPPSDFCV